MTSAGSAEADPPAKRKSPSRYFFSSRKTRSVANSIAAPNSSSMTTGRKPTNFEAVEAATKMAAAASLLGLPVRKRSPHAEHK